MFAAMKKIQQFKYKKRVTNVGYIFPLKKLAVEDIKFLRGGFRSASIQEDCFGEQIAIGDLCKNGTQLRDIVTKFLCHQAMPQGEKKGKPFCYGECAPSEACGLCINDEFAARLLRTRAFEDKEWKDTDRVTYMSYSNKEKDGERSQMSLLVKYRVHPKEFLDYFSRLCLEYFAHMAKLKNQKKAHADQERNLLLWDLVIDIDFSQNMNYTKRASAVVRYVLTPYVHRHLEIDTLRSRS
jgi:hypothetical protein